VLGLVPVLVLVPVPRALARACRAWSKYVFQLSAFFQRWARIVKQSTVFKKKSIRRTAGLQNKCLGLVPVLVLVLLPVLGLVLVVVSCLDKTFFAYFCVFVHFGPGLCRNPQFVKDSIRGRLYDKIHGELLT
jgi:hypothetical protein